ncbi:hypothetical protein [Pseudomonas bubulae]|uniref:hypothetical protein n=1 Tax=Pseudomonas bubulae TaxID=2316085 RepID=UPI002B1D6714|nr:hypothetical protein [Pseudomonas bubulae]
MKESYKLLVALNKNELRPLLDEKKVLVSTLYSQAITHCVAHSIAHREYSLLGVLVNVFETRDYRLFVSGWLCERLGLLSKMGPNGAVFARSGNPPNERMSWKVSLEEFAARKFKIALPVKKLVHDTKPVEKGRKSPKKIDMLDSWARLPGSYGSGKR